MIRKIINIDKEKCNGCGLCATACHEGAIEIVNNKAQLIKDDYCDGLGNCLPVCPTGAITFVEREAAEYDEEAVKERMQKNEGQKVPCSCPGTQAKKINAGLTNEVKEQTSVHHESKLGQWPVQIKLVPVNAPYFDNADLLIAADCTAYAYADFHNKFMNKKITLIGCPKLDEADYSEKLSEIIKQNNIKSVSVVRMEVPCCRGLENAVKEALIKSGKMIPWSVTVISLDGKIIE